MLVGSPSTPEGLVGRQEEVKEIVDKMKSGIGYNLALIGYRRIGKSSVLAKVGDILDGDKKTVVVNFDVQYNMGEPKSFLRNLQGAIFEAYMKKLGTFQRLHAKAKHPEFISRIASALSSKKIRGVGVEMYTDAVLGDVRVMPKLEFATKEKDYRSMFETVFATVNAIADDSGFKFVIILDEFQDMIKLKRYRGLKNIMDLFRGVLQQRSKNVSYVVCGSQVHLLETLLLQGDSSLFQHFAPISIGEMKKKEAVKLFNTYLKNRGKKSKTALANDAYDLVGGHPYYLMALAEDWSPKKSLKEIFETSISSPVGILRLYANYVISEAMSRVQGGPILNSILMELAKSDAGMTYTEIGGRFDEPANSMAPYMKEMVKTDLVKKDGTKYFVRDRVIKEFLRYNF